MSSILTDVLVALVAITIFFLTWRARSVLVEHIGVRIVSGWRYLLSGTAMFSLGQIVHLVFSSIAYQAPLPEFTSNAFIGTSSTAIAIGLVLVAVGLYQSLSVVQALSSESDSVKKSNSDLRDRVFKDEALLSMIPAVFYRATIYRSAKPIQITFENDMIEGLLGYTMQDFEVNPGLFASLMHEEDRSKYPKDSNSFWHEKEIIVENRFRHKNGEYRWIRRHLKSFPAENDGTDVAANTYGCLFDITDLKEAQARLTNFLEEAPDPVITTNEKSEIVLVNAEAERQFGYPKEELIGKRIDTLVPDEASARFLITKFPEYMKITTSQTIDVGAELFGQRKDGTKFHAEVSVSPLENGNQKLLAFAVRDVSARKKIEAQLREAREKELRGSREKDKGLSASTE